MPQEFLRDVLRNGDSAGRRRRHWSVLPLSIAGHAVILTVFLFSPWLTEADLPVIASPLPAHYIETVPPPAPPAPRITTPAPERQKWCPCRSAGRDRSGDFRTVHARGRRRTSDGARYRDGTAAAERSGRVRSGGASAPAAARPQTGARRWKHLGAGKILDVAPIYPEIARRAQAQGAVVIEAILDATGTVDSVRVLDSEPLLDEGHQRRGSGGTHPPSSKDTGAGSHDDHPRGSRSNDDTRDLHRVRVMSELRPDGR